LSLLTSAAQNLASPAVLFFLLGVGASRLRSDLEVPPPVSKALSLYLVFSIGFRGGSELALGHGSLSLWVLLPLALGLAASTVGVAFLLLRLLGGRVGMEDRAAVAAHYGSVSVATFAAATAYLGSQGLAADGSLLVLLAAMEVPGILLALSVGLRASQGREGGLPWHELLTSAPLLLLMGSMAVGLLSGAKGQASLAPVVEGVFPGLLCLFLLDMGVVAGRRLNAFKEAGLRILAFGVAMPLLGGALGLLGAHLAGLDVAGRTLAAVLAGSASYIAAPAAVRQTLPGANLGLSLGLALGVTFPFNVLVGIPLWHALSLRLGA